MRSSNEQFKTDVTMSQPETHSAPIEISGKKYDVDEIGQDIVEIRDRSGNVIRSQLFEGVYLPTILNLSCLTGIRGFKMRSDDIYLPGYPRTGTNWTYEMASMLLSGKAETIKTVEDRLEMFPPEDIAKLPSPRVINCRLKLSLAPEDVKRKKIKILYTLRDPRDVAASAYNIYHGVPVLGWQYKGSFGDFLQLFMAGTVLYNGYFEHLLDAEKFFAANPDIPVHFQIYEDTIKDPLKSVQKLSDFLGLSRNDVLCHEIAEKCQFKRLKADKENYTIKVDGKSFLFRKGIVGDWNNYFTEDMLEEYHCVYDQKMAGSRFYKLYAKDSN